MLSPYQPIIVPKPHLNSVLQERYNQLLAHRIRLAEIIPMLIFIEYFSAESDREFLRIDYLNMLCSRAIWYKHIGVHPNRQNNFVGEFGALVNPDNREHVLAFANDLRNVGYPIPFTAHEWQMLPKYPESSHQIVWLKRMRHFIEQAALEQQDLTDQLYTAVVKHITAHPIIAEALKKYSHQFVGVLPRVKENMDGSFMIFLIPES